MVLNQRAQRGAQGRQQRAYEHYVRKSSLGRAKQQKRMSAKKDSKIPVLEPTEPMEATELSGPESASSNGSY